MKKRLAVSFRFIVIIVLCLCLCQTALADVLTLPAGLKSIGDEAFFGDSSLDEVVLPEGVQSIGEKAFSESSLQEISLPASLTSIADDAFDEGVEYTAPSGSYAAEWIEAHTEPEEPWDSSPLEWFEFEDNEDGTCTLSKYIGPLPNEQDIIIPRKNAKGKIVTRIGDNSFSSNPGLRGGLAIPDTVISIGESAFYFCENMTGNLIIPNSVTSIESYAFYFCCNFTGNLTIPDSVLTIGELAFYACYGFSGNLIIGNHVNSLSYGTFSDCYHFTGDLILPNSLTIIPGCAFSNCGSFTNLIIPDSVQIIEKAAFHNSGFTGKLIIPESVTSIGENAFSNCDYFTGDLIIPNSVISIGKEAFADSEGFSGSLIISDSISVISEQAFRGCSGLSSLTIPDSVTTICDYAFWNCFGISSLTIPDSVTTIGVGAFSGCSGLAGVLVIPDSITSIANYTFSYCSGLISLIIPNSVTTIGSKAFYGCSGLSGNLTIPDSVIMIGSNAFYECSGLTGSLTLSKNVTSIGEKAFYVNAFDTIKFSAVYTVKNCYAWDWCASNGFNNILVGWSGSYSSLKSNYCISHAGSILLKSDTANDSLNSSFDMHFGAAASTGDIYTLTIETNEKWSLSSHCDWITINPDQESGQGNGKIVLLVNDNAKYDEMIGYVLLSVGTESITGRIIKPAWFPGLVSNISGQVFELIVDSPESDTPLFSKAPLADVSVTVFSKDDDNQPTIKIISTSTADDGYWYVDQLTPNRSYSILMKKEGYFFDNKGYSDIYVVNGENIHSNIYTAKEELLDIIPGSSSDNENGLNFYWRNYLAGETITILDDFTAQENSDGSYTTIKYNGNDSFVTIPKGVTIIGEQTFYDNENLKNIVIPDGVVRIEKEAFKNCYSLGIIKIPQSVEYIGESAFESCIFTSAVEIAGTPIIRDSAFAGCSALTKVSASQYIPDIGDYAFFSCWNLSEAPLSEGLKSIGRFAFSRCPKIKTVLIPDSVSNIDLCAFSNCDALQTVIIPATVRNFNTSVFDADIHIEEIHVVKNSSAYNQLYSEGWESKLIVADDPNQFIQKPEMSQGLFAEYFVYNGFFSANPETFMTAENKRAERVEPYIDYSWKPVEKDYTDKSITIGAVNTVTHKELEVYSFSSKGKGTKTRSNILYVPEKFGVKMNGYLQAYLKDQKGIAISLRLRGDNGILMTVRKDGKALPPAKDWDAGSDNVAVLSEKIIVGDLYEIEIDHYSNGGDANLILEYNSLSSDAAEYDQGWKTVPGDWLYCGNRTISISGRTSIQTLYSMRMDAIDEKINAYMHTTWKELLSDMVSTFVGDPLKSMMGTRFQIGNDYLSGSVETVKKIRQRIMSKCAESLKDKLVSTLCKMLTEWLSSDIQEGKFFSKLWEIIAKEMNTTVEKIIPDNFNELKTDLEKYLVMREFAERQQVLLPASERIKKITSLLSFSDYDHRKEGYKMNPDAAVETYLFIDEDTHQSIDEMKGILSESKDAENLCNYANQAFSLLKDLKKDVDRAAATINLLCAENGIDWFKGLTNIVGYKSSGDTTGLSNFEKMLGIYIRANNSEEELSILVGGHLPYLTGNQCAQILAADQSVSLDNLLYRELFVMTLDAAKGVYKSLVNYK